MRKILDHMKKYSIFYISLGALIYCLTFLPTGENFSWTALIAWFIVSTWLIVVTPLVVMLFLGGSVQINIDGIIPVLIKKIKNKIGKI